MLVKGRNNAVVESVFLNEVGNDWPLIRFLLDDPTYFEQYKLELQAAIDGPLEPNALFQKMDQYHKLIAPYVSGAEGEQAPYSFLRDKQDFDGSLESGRDGLKPHITDRISRVRQALQ